MRGAAWLARSFLTLRVIMPSAETGMGGKMITRHNVLRDVFSTCQQAAQALVREVRALLPGAEARPAGTGHCSKYNQS